MLALTLIAGQLWAIDPREFATPELRERYERLIFETRCLVCQNQNLADSNASLAKDLRGKIVEMLEEGRSDDEIRAFLTERYGDFVLYRPPLKGGTLALWFGPAIVLLLGMVGLAMALRRRMRVPPEQLAGEEAPLIQERLRQLRDEEL